VGVVEAVVDSVLVAGAAAVAVVLAAVATGVAGNPLAEPTKRGCGLRTAAPFSFSGEKGPAYRQVAGSKGADCLLFMSQSM
jgi:hypothetical protein